MLDLADFGTEPARQPSSASSGVCRVRFGKAAKGSARRNAAPCGGHVWAVGPRQALEQWVSEVSGPASRWPPRPAPRRSGPPNAAPGSAATCSTSGSPPTGRRTRAGTRPGPPLAALPRHSYVTHLIEGGWDPLFVQQQAGHEHASTTALYTCVSSDFRTRTLRQALDATAAAVAAGGRTS